MSYDVFARFSQDGLPPASRELAGEPAARPISSQTLDEMKELHAARRALVKDRTAAFNREKLLRSGLLKRQAAQRLRQIATQIEAIDAALATLRDADPGLKLRFDILASIPGIGATTAFAMLIEMPELGTLEHRHAAGLAGLAPVARQSGRWTGRAFIRGGRAGVRPSPLPASPRRRPFQLRPQGQIRTACQSQKARKSPVLWRKRHKPKLWKSRLETLTFLCD